VFIILAIALFVYLTCMVALAQYKGDTSIANFTWGGGVLLVTVLTFFMTGSFLLRQLIVFAMIAFWSLRLIMHVYRRYTGKDPRFTSWHWQGLKALAMNSLWIYGQIIMIAIMSYPMILINRAYVPALTFFDIVGIMVWIVGYIIEAISDRQLFVFMQNPAHKGQVLQTGLWHYSRHPNYFGESLMWWGIWLIALSVPGGLSALIAPITITFLLRYVTGVPLLERAMKDNPEYQKYSKIVSPFVPWFRH
jgi:steroid 5-alpha reductase family enzyme